MAETSPVAVEKKEGPKMEVVEAVNLLAEGKRNVFCGEIPQAVAQLQKACSLLAQVYGETANECGEAYLSYGKALLDLSRMESGVLGNALQGIDEDEDSEEKSEKSEEKSTDDQFEDPAKLTEEEREKLAEQVYDAMAVREEEKAAETPATEGENKDNEEKIEDKAADEVKEAEKTTEGENVEKKAEETTNKEESTSEIVETTNGEKVEETTTEKKTEEASAETTEVTKTEETMESTAEAKEDEKTVETTEETTKTEGESSTDKPEAMETETKDTEEEEEGDEESQEEGEKSQDEEEKDDGESTEDKKEDEEDVSNLQLAWEMLELAKVIFTRQDRKETKMKAAEAHLRLGEVGLETESYEQALGDFKECLAIQLQELEADNRQLAETYYQIGLCYNFQNMQDDAIVNFRKAADVMEAKIAKLSKMVEDAEESRKGKEPPSFDDPIFNAHKELKELREVLPDILAKIDDCEEEKKSVDKLKELVKENMSEQIASGFGAAGDAVSGSPQKAAQDISHLVRKKRKPEEEAVKEDSDDAKKARIDESPVKENTADASGDAKHLSNGTVNGTNGTTEDKADEIIVTKTVEDVTKATEEASAPAEEQKMETEAATA